MLSDSETMTLFKSTAVKKREALSALNHFNALSGHYTNSYQKVCDDIFINTKKRLGLASTRYNTVLNFFKEFKFTASMDNKLSAKLNEISDKERSAEIRDKTSEEALDAGLGMFYSDLRFLVDGANKLQSSKESDTVGNMMRDIIRKMEAEVRELVERTRKNYSTLQTKGQSIARRLQEFNRSFNVSIKDNEIGSRCAVDTIDGLVTYRNRLQALVDSLAQYGKDVLGYREAAVELGHKYNQSLKHALTAFTKSFSEFFGDINNLRFGRSLAHISAIDLDANRGEYFDLASLIHCRRDLEAILANAPPTLKGITAALTNIQLQPFESLFALFSRKYYEFAETPNSAPDHSLFITLDFFFAVYKKNKSNVLEKVMSLPVESVDLELNTVTSLVKCSYKTKIMFWGNTKTIKMHMRPEHMDELILSHDFATNVVKDTSPLSPASSLRQMTQEIGTTEEDMAYAVDDMFGYAKKTRDDIMESYIEDTEVSDSIGTNHTGSEQILHPELFAKGFKRGSKDEGQFGYRRSTFVELDGQDIYESIECEQDGSRAGCYGTLEEFSDDKAEC